MKLYATVIGMKQGKYVEKGQGSNQSLQIEILADGLKSIPTRANMYRISLNVGNANELQAELLDYSTGKTIHLTEHAHDWGAFGKCVDCGKWNIEKGEKQKGESIGEIGYPSDNGFPVSLD